MEKFKVTAENFHTLPKELQDKITAYGKERNKDSGLIFVPRSEMKNYKYFEIDPSIEGNPIAEADALEWEKLGLKRIKHED